ncbi:hypothetical protein C2G38_2129221 [Gigaspora rosea]|uniref:Uncharacterized protein n=1 Tax=Gigaspora rosea TaxID=44941 RepID=A0A397U024_9GLOM|nr:hypothetical protein C2G38_2129221 [Gigaspora rosea]
MLFIVFLNCSKKCFKEFWIICVCCNLVHAYTSCNLIYAHVGCNLINIHSGCNLILFCICLNCIRTKFSSCLICI